MAKITQEKTAFFAIYSQNLQKSAFLKGVYQYNCVDFMYCFREEEGNQVIRYQE